MLQDENKKQNSKLLVPSTAKMSNKKAKDFSYLLQSTPDTAKVMIHCENLCKSHGGSQLKAMKMAKET